MLQEKQKLALLVSPCTRLSFQGNLRQPFLLPLQVLNSFNSQTVLAVSRLVAGFSEVTDDRVMQSPELPSLASLSPYWRPLQDLVLGITFSHPNPLVRCFPGKTDRACLQTLTLLLRLLSVNPSVFEPRMIF